MEVEEGTGNTEVGNQYSKKVERVILSLEETFLCEGGRRRSMVGSTYAEQQHIEMHH